MSSTKQQPKDFIKSLQIIHIALVVTVVGFAVYIAQRAGDKLFFSYEEDRAFLFLAIIVAFIGNLSSKFIYKKLIGQISSKQNLFQKATKFSTAHVFRMAMLEFPALMCVLFVYQSNNSFYFILTGILVLMMASLHPTKNKFESDVPLTNEEKSMLEKL